MSHSLASIKKRILCFFHYIINTLGLGAQYENQTIRSMTIQFGNTYLKTFPVQAMVGTSVWETVATKN